MKTTIATMLVLAAFGSTPDSFAGTRDPVVNARQMAQHDRIRQGERNGSLTVRESLRLRGEQAALRAEERAFKADGNLTLAERAKLRTHQNAASRHIWREKHDGQHR